VPVGSAGTAWLVSTTCAVRKDAFGFKRRTPGRFLSTCSTALVHKVSRDLPPAHAALVEPAMPRSTGPSSVTTRNWTCVVPVGEGRTDPVIWVGTSWKMNKTLAEAAAFIDELSAYPVSRGIQPFVLPAHTALASVRDRLPGDSPILLGAQNAHWGPEGEGTGEISMRMAADAGATLIEIGHSERREHFGETDHTVSLKVAAALDHGLIPLICVGEPSTVRDAGQARGFVTQQVAAALSRVAPSRIGEVIIAYEPIWAIGPSGQPARPDEVAPVLASISDVVADISGGGSARAILYGGSVNRDNVADLLGDPHAGGLFVGRAGWAAPAFIHLLELCAPFAQECVRADPAGGFGDLRL
jgi:L-erythrulose 1-phosphate isomerase